MPKKQKQETLVNYWMEQVRYAKMYKKKYSTSSKWDKWRKMYRGNWIEDILPLNVTFASGRTIVPRAYFRNPRVLVQPTHPMYEFPARILEQIDNWLIKETLLKQTIRGAVLNGYISGTGPIKLGFDSEFGFSVRQASEGGETFTQVGKKEKRVIEYNTAIKPGMPWALPILPDDVIIPFGYKYPNQLPWIGQEILRPLEDVLQDSKYTFTKPLQGTKITDIIDPPKSHSELGKEGELPICELTEIRDGSQRTMLVLCEDQLIYAQPDILQVEGLPWEFIIFNEDPEHFWGISDVGVIEGQQLEINEIKTQIQHHRAIALIKFLAVKGSLESFDIKGLLSGDVGPYVEVDTDNLAAAITTMQPHIPGDLFTASREVLGDIQETLRISANQMAAFKAGTPPTAQETAEVSGSHSEDVDDRRDIVSDTLINIVRKWNQMIFSLWNKERVIRIVGPDGAQWVSYTGDQIRGEYNFEVEMDTGFHISRQTRMQAADKLLAQFGGDMTMNTMELKRMVLREFEWIFPGLTSLVYSQLPSPIADAESAMRQPHPQGAGGMGSQSEGNRGGGRQAGDVMSFDEGKKQYNTEGGTSASE